MLRNMTLVAAMDCKRRARASTTELADILCTVADNNTELYARDSSGRTIAFLAATTPCLNPIYVRIVEKNPPVVRSASGAAPFNVLAACIAWSDDNTWDAVTPLFWLVDPLLPNGTFPTEIDVNKYAYLIKRWSTFNLLPVPAIRFVFLTALLLGAEVDRENLHAYAASLLDAYEALHPDSATRARAIALAARFTRFHDSVDRLRAPTPFPAPDVDAVEAFLSGFNFPAVSDRTAYTAAAPLVAKYVCPAKKRSIMRTLLCCFKKGLRGTMFLPPELVEMVMSYMFSRGTRPVYAPTIGVEDLVFDNVTQANVKWVVQHHVSAIERFVLLSDFDLYSVTAIKPASHLDRMRARIFLCVVAHIEFLHLLLWPDLMDRAHVCIGEHKYACGDFQPLNEIFSFCPQIAPSALLQGARHAASCPYTPEMVQLLSDYYRDVNVRFLDHPGHTSHGLMKTSTTLDQQRKIYAKAKARSVELGFM